MEKDEKQIDRESGREGERMKEKRIKKNISKKEVYMSSYQ